jgi:hypothetical protein
MSMSADERKARVWLAQVTGQTHYLADDDARHRATILALLDRPVMPRPEDVPAEVIGAMCAAYRNCDTGQFRKMRAAIKVLHDALTKREPVKVEAWAVICEANDHLLDIYKAKHDAKRNATPGSRIVHLVEADNAD